MTKQFKPELKTEKQRHSAQKNNPKDYVQQPDKITQPSPKVVVYKSTQQPKNSYFRQTYNKFRNQIWQPLSLKTKATIIAIAMSTLPTIAIASVGYLLISDRLTENVTQQQQARVISLANELDKFVVDRYKDIQTLSQLSIFNSPQVRLTTSSVEKAAVLDRYIKNNPVYDSIAVINLDGNTIVKSGGEVPLNFKNIVEFQEVLKTNRPFIAPPKKSMVTGEYSLFAAAPVIDTVTGNTIAIVRSRMPMNYLSQMLSQEANELTSNINAFGSEEHFVINENGQIVIASTEHPEYIGKNAQLIFPQATAITTATNKVASVIDIEQQERQKYLISYTPIKRFAGLEKLTWSAILAQPTEELFAARRDLLLAFIVGTGLTVALVSAIASLLVNRVLRPVINASSTVRKLGQGKLDTRINIAGKDELAVLGSSINLMADQLQTLLQKQEEVAERTQLFADVTFRIRRSLNLEDILKTAVKEVRKVLRTDRVVIYKFNSDFSGTIVAESVAPGWTQALSERIEDPCFRERHIKQYQEGRVRAIDNIYQAGLTDCHIKILEQFEVKANIVAPILKDNDLLGLLIAHHCSEPRDWQHFEIDLFTQLATQTGFALDQAHLLEQVEKARQTAEGISQEQRQQKEALEAQLLELLDDVEDAAQGDLTARAEVTAGEIGTVADFFNAIIESLRQLVTQVKTAATQVTVSIGDNQTAVRLLADQALNQVEEITHTLTSLEQMTFSIQSVANTARKAAVVARTASSSAQAGEVAMERTVASISNLRETVAHTANKVKHLGESSQQISKVVVLIQQIALQTNVLAINASIEAARAGEEGRGFGVVSEEVAQLAAKSSTATKEIEQVVENIQRETSEVVKAMELGNAQVIEGNFLIAETKQSLRQILDVSVEIDQLVQSISTATVSQVQTAASVTNLMKELAQVSQKNSNSSRQVSQSLQETVEIAQQLQTSVDVFKVDAD